MKLQDAIQGYVLSITADGYSRHTIEMYTRDLERLCEHLGNPELEAISTQDLQGWLAYMRNEFKPTRPDGDTRPLAPGTLNICYRAIRSFYNWAENSLELKRPDKTIKAPKFEYPEIRPFCQGDIQRLVQACCYTAPADTNGRKSFVMKRSTGKRDLALLLVLLDTGIRAAECARLNIGDISIESGQVFIAPHGSGRKTKSRHVFLGRKAQKAVWDYVTSRVPYQSDEPLFVSKNERRMDRSTIRHVIVNLGKRASVASCFPHRFRHTFAIEYLKNTGDTFSLQRLLGHSSPDMSRHYATLALGEIKEIHRRASPVDRWQL
ncbi:MAG TPA: tyrosine-type recombinase/integrase [Anaerolineales bacterium]|nr:tyrosine-type recombinase/integrase [Anaerolineales bacterium]